jgi:4-hydroxybenzoate polyprenyltransferase
VKINILLYRFLQWKNHLIPPLFVVVYIFFPFHLAETRHYIQLVCYILAIFFISFFGYWVNDSFDISLDKKAGKFNFLDQTTPIFRLMGAVIIASMAFLFWFFTDPPMIATFFFFSELILFTIYSIPVIRFKNHPVLGPLLDAHYTHIFPVFFTYFLFASSAFQSWLLVLYLLLLCKGLRNIFLHQLQDRKGDTFMQLKTFPIVTGPLFTVRLINRIIIPIEIILITLITFILTKLSWYPLLVWIVFLLMYCLFFSCWDFYYMYSYNKRYFLFKYHYFLNDFYEFWLPFLAIWASVLNIQTKIILSVMHLLIFNKTIQYFQKLIFKIFFNLGIIKNS